MEIKFQNVTTFLKILTWKKIFQTIVFFLIIGTAYALWENRVIVYNSLRVNASYKSSEPLVLSLSKDTVSYIDTSTNKSKELVAGIQIVSVDFKKNIRITSYFSITDANLGKSYEIFKENKIAPTPLFTDMEANNQRVIDLINGEFVCKNVEETLAGLLLPDIKKSVTTVCSISIPPYYGRFSGYMNVYLKRPMTEADMIFVKQLSRDISLRIYEYDISRLSGSIVN